MTAPRSACNCKGRCRETSARRRPDPSTLPLRTGSRPATLRNRSSGRSAPGRGCRRLCRRHGSRADKCPPARARAHRRARTTLPALRALRILRQMSGIRQQRATTLTLKHSRISTRNGEKFEVAAEHARPPAHEEDAEHKGWGCRSADAARRLASSLGDKPQPPWMRAPDSSFGIAPILQLLPELGARRNPGPRAQRGQNLRKALSLVGHRSVNSIVCVLFVDPARHHKSPTTTAPEWQAARFRGGRPATTAQLRTHPNSACWRCY